MAFKVDISVTRLRANDSITFTLVGGPNAGTYVIDIVPSTQQPATLQIRATDDVLPTSNEFTQAVIRLRNGIEQINGVSTQITTDTIITVTFDDQVTGISVIISEANGSLINHVRTIAPNGTATDIDPALVPNITITDIRHNLKDYPYTPLNYPHGNMGDVLRTEIDFTVADSFNVLDFYYGWIDNEDIVYPSAGSGIFEIDKNDFRDITTGALQKYTGDTSSINAVAPLQGNKVTLITLGFVGGNDYTLTIEHHIPILPRPIDVSSVFTLNKPAEINTSLRFIFQIDLKDDNITPNPKETTAKEDLTQFISAGNIGYVNEVYKTGQTIYTLNSFNWNNPEQELNSGLTSNATILIDKTSSADANHDVILKIQKLTDVFDETQSLLQNYDFDSVQVKTDGTPNSSTALQNVTASFSGSQITINFDVAPGTIEGDYSIVVALANGTASKQNQNVDVKIGTAISAADETQLIFGTYPSAPRSEYNYNVHYLDDIAESFNQVKSYIDDFLISRFRVETTDPANNTLQSFTLRLRDGNNNIETFTITSGNLSSGVYEIERDFNLLPTDTRKKIVVTDNLDGTWDFIYPFQITEDMINANELVQETSATFTQTITGGTAEYTNNWISPVFDLGDYNISKNSPADPQVTFPPSKIQFFDETGTNEVGVILSSGKTLVVATFEEDNLNDFLADPAAPFVYPDNTPTSNYLTAYFGLNTSNNIQSKYFRFHNLRDNEQSPWEQVPSLGLNYFARLERLDIDTATLTALIDSDKIREQYGDDFECLRITARLDRIQTSAVVAKAYKNDSYTEGYS